jgi:uncharacterized surface protein with fasciclin (FAS1) repeats
LNDLSQKNQAESSFPLIQEIQPHMKKIVRSVLLLSIAMSAACSAPETVTSASESTDAAVSQPAGQSGVQDNVSNPNIVQIAAGSKDHSTLVKAVQTAELVDALSNAGPFTVFAPTNAAFSQLPEGTVESLLEAEKKDDLTDILQYHVSLGVFKPEMLTDGQVIGQVNGGNITISNKGGKLMVNGTATIIASIPAANGIVHVIDGVLLPANK